MITFVKNGGIKNAPTGFSWTTLFFGFFPAIIRGDLKWGIIMFIIAIVTGGLSWFIFPFIYNKIYIKSLIEAGYTPKSSSGENILRSMGLYERSSNINPETNMYSHAEELKKWSELYRDGIITKEEYEIKKSEFFTN
ncbi:MAG: SHOCT domain-containing protein [Fusobacterium sp.]